MNQALNDSSIDLLYCKTQDIHLCIELCQIEKTVLLAAIDPLPRSADFVAGLLNIAGNSVIVIDLAIYLGRSRHSQYTLDTPILLCRTGKQLLGIIIDKIIKITYENRAAIQRLNPLDQDSKLFNGVIPIDNQLALIIDVKRLASINFFDQSIES